MTPLQPVLSIRVDAHYFGELRLSLVQTNGYHDFKTESHIRMYKISCWYLRILISAHVLLHLIAQCLNTQVSRIVILVLVAPRFS